MSRGEVVLCVGMHRSGTSLTASLLEGLGVCLPGDLIAADAANLSGYFENRSIVAAQEQLLQDLGYWWPTERASHGMPASVLQQQVYSDYVDWLTNHLDELLLGGLDQIAIKDPRTSLLMPAWRQAAARLGLTLRAVICVREPRDVCWSLVWRDGPSVGMTWSRAQRLWMGHYRALLQGLGGTPAFVVRYEHWLDPHAARDQLHALASFVGRSCTAEQQQAALGRVRPEFNHGGAHQLPRVDRSLRRLHASLVKPGINPARLVRHVDRCARSLERQRLKRALLERLHLLWLQTPWGQRALGRALDPETLREQLGTTSLRAYRRVFLQHPDLRPHPLISPAHLNQERLRRGLPPLRSADDLFRHLLYPDLLPLDPHPWFDSRYYQSQTGELGLFDQHPVLSYLDLQPAARLSTHPQIQNLPWLNSLGCLEAAPWHRDQLPVLIQKLHPGLVLADPKSELGDPELGGSQLLAHERYWSEIQSTFGLWPDSDPDGPLRWLSQQPNVGKLGLTEQPPARGFQLWWLSGHWEARLLAELAGVEISDSRHFLRAEDLHKELLSMSLSGGAHHVLVALTAPLLELFLADSSALPTGLSVLNLVWPRPSQQSPWLHLLAQAALVVECRSAVRAYLQGLGFRAVWTRPIGHHTSSRQLGAPTLLLALGSGPAEAQLAAAAPSLKPDRYNAILRLDAELQLRDPAVWLEEKQRSHGSWLWLNPLPPAGDPKGHAVMAWAQQRGVTLRLLSDPPEPGWWSGLTQ